MDYHVEHGEQLESEVQNIKHPSTNAAPVQPVFYSYDNTKLLQSWKFGKGYDNPIVDSSVATYRIEHDGWLRVWLKTDNLDLSESEAGTYIATVLKVVVHNLTVAVSDSACGHSNMHNVDQTITFVPVKAGDTFSFAGTVPGHPSNWATLDLFGIRY